MKNETLNRELDQDILVPTSLDSEFDFDDTEEDDSKYIG